MAITETKPEVAPAADVATDDRPGPGSLERLIGSGDHKHIGRLYIGSSLVFLAASLAGLALVGADRAADNDILGTAQPLILSSSTVGLLILGLMPLVLGLGVHLVPLQVGSPSIAFPRAAAASFWGWLVGAGIFATSVALDGGVGGTDTDAVRMGHVALALSIVSLLLGVVCVATTVMADRPAGLSLRRVPLFAFSWLPAALVWLATLPVIVAHILIGHISNLAATDLYDQVFVTGASWIIRQPAVWIVAVPVLGLIGDIVPVLAKVRLARYGILQGLIAGFGILSFGAWAQLAEARETILWVVTALLALLLLLAFVGGLAASLKAGRPSAASPLGLALVSILLLIGGAVAGVLLGLDTLGGDSLSERFSIFEKLDDPQLIGFSGALVLAQLAFVAAGVLAGATAALQFWGVKLWGGEPSESQGKALVLLALAGGGLWGTAQLVESIVQRNGGDTADAVFGGLFAVGAALVLLAALGAIGSILSAAKAGQDGGPQDPWEGHTLEWATPTPVPESNFVDELPVIASERPLLDLRDGKES